jgi:hypothetical protein
MTQRFEFDILEKNKEYLEASAISNGRSTRNEATWLLNELIQNYKDSHPIEQPKWMQQSEVTNDTLKIKP